MTCLVASGKLKRSSNKVAPNDEALDPATTIARPAVCRQEGISCSPAHDSGRHHKDEHSSVNDYCEHVRRESPVKTAWAAPEQHVSTFLRSNGSGDWCGSPAAAVRGGLPEAAAERRLAAAAAAASASSPPPQADSRGGFESSGDRCPQPHLGGQQLTTSGRTSLPQIVVCATILRLRSSSARPPPPPETLLGQPVSSRLKKALSKVACLEAQVQTDEAIRQQVERFRALRAAQRRAVVEEAIRGMDWQNVPIKAWKMLKAAARKDKLCSSQDSRLDGQVRGDSRFNRH